MPKEFGFDAGEAEAIVAALEPQIRRVAAEAWAKHPRNPINMTEAEVERELLSTDLKPARRELLEAEMDSREDHRDAAPCDGGTTPGGCH